MSPCRWFKEELPVRPQAPFSVSHDRIKRSLFHGLYYLLLFMLDHSCCHAVLSGAQHPPGCPTGPTHRLWRFRSRLVSFTFQSRVNLHCTSRLRPKKRRLTVLIRFKCIKFAPSRSQPWIFRRKLCRNVLESGPSVPNFHKKG